MTKHYWTEDKYVNAVIEGDCIQIMQRIPDDSIDMVLCDLPYGTTQNKWDSLVPLEKLWTEYKRIVKDDGAIVLTSQGIFTAVLIMSQPKLFKYKWVWEKSKATNFLNAKKQPLRKHEDVCVFYKKQPVYHPQMTEGEPYDKGFRKVQLSGSYGDFQSVHVKSDGKRYPTDVVYFKTESAKDSYFNLSSLFDSSNKNEINFEKRNLLDVRFVIDTIANNQIQSEFGYNYIIIKELSTSFYYFYFINKIMYESVVKISR